MTTTHPFQNLGLITLVKGAVKQVIQGVALKVVLIRGGVSSSAGSCRFLEGDSKDEGSRSEEGHDPDDGDVEPVEPEGAAHHPVIAVGSRHHGDVVHKRVPDQEQDGQCQDQTETVLCK